MSQNLCVKLSDRLASLNECKGDVRQAMTRVLESGLTVLGPEVDAFEGAFARWLGVGAAVGVSSGTDAVMVALQVAGVRSGDRVVVDALASGASLVALTRLGAQPVRADVERATLTLAPAALEDILARESVQAVLVTHRDGHPADLPALKALCDAHRVALVEDCTEALGAAQGGRRVGCVGVSAAFCFGPERTLAALGRAGLVTCAQAEGGGALRTVRDTLLDCPMDSLQAAVLRAQLRGVDGAILRRQSIALRYDTALGPLGVVIPTERSSATHAYCRYVIRVADPQPVRAALAALGLGEEALWPFGTVADPLMPVAAQAVQQGIAVPVYPQLPAEHQRAVIAAIASAVRA
ncbi:DegT/DnrJ/EryC1/StrS family aminotransferase [Pararhodospirillum photometricum]|uniref:DegT/DnrJ/EryC1/StrS family aminotransferase n=1 Tax=Pararhodospirillum photometricum TaxID=1084 RepID=UPI000313D567|nr:DegT/DnrJ/EryC1/StrS family aminotransferase [Pararhodospirillum photometricum]